MNVLLTGAFGNVGQSTLTALLKKGHAVRCFDVENRSNARTARRFRGQIETIWGDLRRADDVAAAVQHQDAVIHLAFIIPKLSSTGFESEDYPDWARAVNVDGTRHLVRAMQARPDPPKLLFASSYHIYGRTQHMPPPRTIDDPVQPIEHYARHKAECERMIRASELDWTILRLAATLPIEMKMDPGMFDVPLDNRMEFVHTRDVGLAFANAVGHPDVWGRILLIGGGPRCQYTYRQITERVLNGLGVGMLPSEAFSLTPFATDWMDTTESQKLLRYQTRTLDDYIVDMKAALGFQRHLVRALRPVTRHWLLKQSPYLYPNRSSWLSAHINKIRMSKSPPEVELG